MSNKHPLHPLFRFMAVLIVLGMALSSFSGTALAGPNNPNREPRPVAEVSLAELEGFYGPLSQMQGEIKILVEFSMQPGVLAYSRGLAISADAAVDAGIDQVSQVKKEQANFLAQVKSKGIAFTEIYRTQRAYNGIWMIVDVKDVKTLAAMPGVKAIHRVISQELDHVTSVPLIGALQAWSGVTEYQGDGINVGIIDTGVDYQHAMFGGTNASVFPTAKVVGGYDFAGDAYDGSNIPSPDSDPMDCNGHGSHVAGTTAGYGVLADGTTFVESPGDEYSDLVGLTASAYQAKFDIGPGVAPKANLYALRVFGCGGSTNLTTLAIEWAMDPDGDMDMSDHLDVINMSLGSSYGSEYDDSAVASNNAAQAGIIVVASAGNSGDVYYITGAPGLAKYALSVASSQDSSARLSGFLVTQADDTPALVKAYPAGNAASIGPQTFNITGEAIASTPAQGCGVNTPFTNAAAVAGKIVLVDRGTCAFAEKAKNAQLSGAIGVVIVNNVAGFPPGLGGADATVTIPVMSSNLTDGNAIKAGITAGPVFINMDSSISALGLDPSFDDVVSSFTSRGIGRHNQLKPDISAPGDTIYSAATGTGNQGASFSGTSMAAPHMSGVMALLKQANPTWTVAELKALAMNTATADVFSTSAKTVRNSPTRVGAGRVNIPNALNSPVVAYLKSDPGRVSVSFGAVSVVSTQSFSQTVEVKNFSAAPITYNLAMVERYGSNAGLTFSILDGSNSVITSLVVPANGTAEFKVRANVNAASLVRAVDPSIATSFVTTYFGTLSRQRMAEGGGFVTLTSTGSEPTLRLPVHIAARPGAAMSVVENNLSLPVATTGTLSLTPNGASIASYGNMYSYAAIMELMAESPNEASSSLTNNAADLKYVGANYDPSYGYVYIGIATHGKWNTPTAYGGPEFDVYFDTDEDGTYDYVLYNADSNVGTTTRTDVLMAWLVDLSDNSLVNAYYINDWSGTYDTNVFNNDVLVLPIDALDLGLDEITNPDFKFAVVTFNREAAGVVDATDDIAYNIAEQAFNPEPGPGVNDYGPFWTDSASVGTFDIAYDKSVIASRGSLGLLILHLHNANNTAEALLLEQPTVSITRTGAANTEATSVDFLVSFSQAVTGVDTADFTVTEGGTLTGSTVSNVTGGPTDYTVTVNGYSGAGSLRLDILNTATITDTNSMPFSGGYTGGQSYNILQPNTVTIVRTGPSAQVEASSVNFTVSFDRAVTGVDTADFTTVTGGDLSGATVSAVSGGPSVYTVTVSGYTGSGSMRLDLLNTATITDTNSLPFSGGHTGDESYTILTSFQVFSNGNHDGWILESTEASSVGGTMSAAGTFRLGDGPNDEQYRSILSFNTAALPDTAVITGVTLKIKQFGGITGNNNPFTWGNGLRADMCKGVFGAGAALALNDLQFTSPTLCTQNIVTFNPTPSAGWYTATLGNFVRVNELGFTQFRLRFMNQDNDDMANDYLSFVSGNSSFDKPVVTIQYYVP